MPTLQQPRLKLYTRPAFYFSALRNLLTPYSKGFITAAEDALQEYTGARNIITTSMGRTAIYEGLRALLNPGDEIIVSPLTVPEVISMIILAGMKPVFCDTRPGYWNLDINKIPDLLTAKTRAIINTHLYGLINAPDEIQALCKKNNIYYIEDAAQALSARNKNKMAGTEGTFGIYSFSYPKNICAFYGGALATDDDDLANKVRINLNQYKNINNKWYYKRVLSALIKDLGTQSLIYPFLASPLIKIAYKKDIKLLKKMVEVHLEANIFEELPDVYETRFSGFQGKLVCEQIPNLDADSRHRIHCAALYNQGLKSIDQIICPPFKDDFSHTYLYYPIEVPDRNKLMHYMIANNRDIAFQHIPNCADLPEFKTYFRDCPNARKSAKSTLTLPTYPKYRLDQVEKNIEMIQNFFKGMKN